MMFSDTLKDLGVVAVIRGISAENAVIISEALLRGGICGIELTYSTPDCCVAIERVVASHGDEAVVGVGTVRTVQQLVDAKAAGARFAVSPHFDPAIMDAALRNDIPMLPGAMTPTEVIRAYDAGAAAVKLFPGSALSPGFLKALRGPLPDIPLMPTGGVSPENMHEWFAAGAVAVGMGGNLAKGTADEVEAAARATVTVLKRLRQ